ncbi:uncharacterized protein LOC128546112 [Mercenaria mercenaria]|uniref:uncharacterized protein LOC128546112 n=1 Tax=Mercenaria mercenaria TaxID=6596 RepID=UPI00234F9DEF|nr:uncharacterized protein LOC128546112 [Mercenaria mercenaria]
MDSSENQHQVGYDIAEEKTYVDSSKTSNQPQKSRTRFIIIGVVAAVIIIAVVIVVVVVVTQTKNDDENKEKKNECGPYTLPDGFNFSMLSPTVISRSFNCPLKGDCWTGEQCYQCLKLDKWKVGNINYIPVCCEDCLVRGLYISNSECRCRK